MIVRYKELFGSFFLRSCSYHFITTVIAFWNACRLYLIHNALWIVWVLFRQSFSHCWMHKYMNLLVMSMISETHNVKTNESKKEKHSETNTTTNPYRLHTHTIQRQSTLRPIRIPYTLHTFSFWVSLLFTHNRPI